MDQDAIYYKLMEISSDIGELKALQTQTNATLIAHIADDKNIETRVSVLEAGVNRQVGAVKVFAVIGTFLGAVGGVIGSLFVRGGHH